MVMVMAMPLLTMKVLLEIGIEANTNLIKARQTRTIRLSNYQTIEA